MLNTPAMSIEASPGRAPVSKHHALSGLVVRRLPGLLGAVAATVAALGLLAPNAHAQTKHGERLRVPGEVFAGEPRREMEAQEASLLRGAFSTAGASFNVELAPLAEAERRAVADGNNKPGAPLQIGVDRRVPAQHRRVMRGSALDWASTSDGGMAATFTARSPGAEAMRLALRLANVPPSAELRFFSVERPEQSFGPYGRDDFRAHARIAADADEQPGPYWSPVIGGDALGVEIYVRRPAQRHRLEFSIERVAHLLYSPRYSDAAAIAKVKVKASQACEIDLACEPGWQSAGNAVARIVFQDGGTYLCTGQLMSDTDSSTTIPYFSTATHCIGNQAAASSIDFFWFDQRTGCGGGGTTTQQTSGGAALLSSSDPDSGTDFSFMRLNQTPPGGVTLLGWDTGTVALGTPITGIHHPAGDVKKISQGTLNGREPWWAQGFDSHLLVNWSSGVTEGGSSGSVLFGPGKRLIGVLTGGGSYCSTPDDPDLYGRFDLSYGAVSQWLTGDGGGGGGGGGGEPAATPDAPQGVAATVSGSSVTISWQTTSSTRAGGVPLSFVVQIGTAPGNSDIVNMDVGLTGSESWTLNDGIYSAQVLAINDAGSSEPSDVVSFEVNTGGGNGGAVVEAVVEAVTPTFAPRRRAHRRRSPTR